jgi:hypothetical protein
MNMNQTRHCPIFFRKPIAGLAVAICSALLLHAETVCAEDAADFRARVIQEVLQEIPDLELAKQVVEIRIHREFLKPQTASNPSPKMMPASKSPAQQRVFIREPIP